MTHDIRNVLFLCTGNVDRSRFAEALFRHASWTRRLGWVALSRGLAGDFRTLRPDGPLSPHAVTGLHRRGIAVPEPIRPPRAAHVHDLRSAHHIVAIDEHEHRPLIEARFPAHAHRVEYWDVPDIDHADPIETHARLADRVIELVERLEHLDGFTRRTAGQSVA